MIITDEEKIRYNSMKQQEFNFLFDDLLIKNIQSIKVENNKKNYTNEILNKIRTAGINVEISAEKIQEIIKLRSYANKMVREIEEFQQMNDEYEKLVNEEQEIIKNKNEELENKESERIEYEFQELCNTIIKTERFFTAEVAQQFQEKTGITLYTTSIFDNENNRDETGFVFLSNIVENNPHKFFFSAVSRKWFEMNENGDYFPARSILPDEIIEKFENFKKAAFDNYYSKELEDIVYDDLKNRIDKKREDIEKTINTIFINKNVGTLTLDESYKLKQKLFKLPYVEVDGIKVYANKIDEVNATQFLQEMQLSSILANYGYEVFILPEQYTKSESHSDTLTNSQFLDLKNLTTKRVRQIGEKFRQAKLQGESVFLYLHEDFNDENIVKEIDWQIKNNLKIPESNIPGRVFVYFEKNRQFLEYEIKKDGVLLIQKEKPAIPSTQAGRYNEKNHYPLPASDIISQAEELSNSIPKVNKMMARSGLYWNGKPYEYTMAQYALNSNLDMKWLNHFFGTTSSDIYQFNQMLQPQVAQEMLQELLNTAVSMDYTGDAVSHKSKIGKERLRTFEMFAEQIRNGNIGYYDRGAPLSTGAPNWTTVNGSEVIDEPEYMFKNGFVAGLAYDNNIILHPDYLSSNAAVHEYTHLWDAYTQKTNPELWNKGLALFKDTKYWAEVISDPNYQDIKDDENLVLSEIHSRICGEIAERVLDRIAELDGEQTKLDAIDWNKEICNYVAENFLANSYSYALFTAEEIDKKSLSSDELKQYELTKEHYKNFSFATIVPEAVNAYNSHNKGKYAALRELADIQNNFYKEFLSMPMKDLMNEKNILINKEVIMENSVTNEILDKIRASGIDVVTNKNEFERFLEQKDKLQKMALSFSKIDFGTVEQWQIEEAKDIGLDLSDYKHQITSDFIIHVIKHHGNQITETSRGNIAITKDDLKSINEIITSADRVVYGVTRKEIVAGQLIDRQRIIYAKNQPDGTSLYFEEVLEGKKNKRLRGKTFFKRNESIDDKTLLSILGNNKKRDNIEKAIIKAHPDAAISSLSQHQNVDVAAVSTVSELGNSISEFVDKSIHDYTVSKFEAYTSGEITYGFVHNGKIYLNPEIMNSNAAVHEYTHLWDAYTQKANPELWGKGLEIFKNTKYWNEVISDPNYQDIRDDENLVLSEIHSRICGDIAEQVLNRIAELDGEQTKLDAIDWNTETWYYICEVMLHKSFSDDYNINYSTGLTSADLTEFLSTPMKDLVEGKSILHEISGNTELAKTVQTMTSGEYNNKEVDAFVTDKSGFVDPEKIAAIDLYGFEKAKKMWENGEPDWETRMMLQDKSISDYLNWKKPNIYKKQIDDTLSEEHSLKKTGNSTINVTPNLSSISVEPNTRINEVFKDFKFDFKYPVTWTRQDKNSLTYCDNPITQEQAKLLYDINGKSEKYNPDMAYCIQYRCPSNSPANLIYLCKFDPMVEITSPETDIVLPENIKDVVLKGVKKGLFQHKKEHHNVPDYVYKSIGVNYINIKSISINNSVSEKKTVQNTSYMKIETSKDNTKLRIKFDNYSVNTSLRSKLNENGFYFNVSTGSWNAINTDVNKEKAVQIMRTYFPYDYKLYKDSIDNVSQPLQKPLFVSQEQNTADNFYNNIRDIAETHPEYKLNLVSITKELMSSATPEESRKMHELFKDCKSPDKFKEKLFKNVYHTEHEKTLPDNLKSKSDDLNSKGL